MRSSTGLSCAGGHDIGLTLSHKLAAHVSVEQARGAAIRPGPAPYYHYSLFRKNTHTLFLGYGESSACFRNRTMGEAKPTQLKSRKILSRATNFHEKCYYVRSLYSDFTPCVCVGGRGVVTKDHDKSVIWHLFQTSYDLYSSDKLHDTSVCIFHYWILMRRWSVNFITKWCPTSTIQ